MAETSPEVPADAPGLTHSKKSMASYGFGRFIYEMFTMAFGAVVFYFYEKELQLDVVLAATGFVIYAIWNAINDPIVGYLSDRSFKFTKKWGRRFPWIIMGGIPWIFSYILIFTPPNVNPVSEGWILLIWLAFTTCLFDTLASLWFVNFVGLFPDKFRTNKERRQVAAIATPIGIIGIALGALVPPLVFEEGDAVSYMLAAGVMVLIGYIAFILSIPGCREDQETIDRYLSKEAERKESEGEGVSFFKTMIQILGQRNFLAYTITYTLYQTLTVTLQASLLYYVTDILELPDDMTTYIMAGFLLGALIAIPMWVKLAQKWQDNRRVMLYAAIGLTIFTAPMIFIENLTVVFIVMILWGVSLGGFWSMVAPVLSDTIDEGVVMFRKRREGVYNGVQAFFARMAIVIQAITFAVVHTMTGYDNTPGATQSALAIWGIHVHTGLIPMLFMAVATLVFWRFYDLTPDKVATIKEQLEEIGL